MTQLDYIVDVTGGRGGKVYLILGQQRTAIIDCGMAYCADRLIQNIQQVLGNKTLDYIFITHSHYDHVGGMPYIKEQWPACRVLGAQYAQRVFASTSALKTIRQLGEQAAALYGAAGIMPYGETLLRVDTVVSDGTCIDLGGVRVKVIATPGHTKCSLSFLVNDVLFASESTGYKSQSGRVYPAFIVSDVEALASIRKCQQLNPRYVISPHYGLVENPHAYWEQCRQALEETRAFILRMYQEGYNEEEIFVAYEQAFRDEHSRAEQPSEAFRLNVQAMIKTVLRTAYTAQK